MVLQSVFVMAVIGRLMANVVSDMNTTCMNMVAETEDALNKEPIYQDEQPEMDWASLYLRELPEMGYHMADRKLDGF